MQGGGRRSFDFPPPPFARVRSSTMSYFMYVPANNGFSTSSGKHTILFEEWHKSTGYDGARNDRSKPSPSVFFCTSMSQWPCYAMKITTPSRAPVSCDRCPPPPGCVASGQTCRRSSGRVCPRTTPAPASGRTLRPSTPAGLSRKHRPGDWGDPWNRYRGGVAG